MKRSLTILASLGLLALVAVTGTAAASPTLHGAKAATARFQDVDKAIEAGYSIRLADLAGIDCIALAGQGAMGIHMVNGSLLDGTINANHPEALVYEPQADGTLKLVAVEYVVFQSAWTGAQPPTLFGQQFGLTPEGNRFGLPSFYALHAWLFKSNPSGVFNPWNPHVHCP